jgi:hypothetical protein
MTGFQALRFVQALEPRAVGALKTADSIARLVDRISTHPVGVVALATSLSDSIVALAAWCHGSPRPGIVALAAAS